VDDAQKMAKIPDNSIDILLCIESALHYPRKNSFLQQVARVLKPSGEFLIADILATSNVKRFGFLERWKRKMSYHHWTESEYMFSFRNSGLSVHFKENITQDIIRGYKGYRKWIQREQFDNYFKYLTGRFIVFIHVSINLLLLYNRRKYLVFVGSKAC
jgi:ubiquinone/menaquinone biosynthesis C-methylase UbiE